MSPVQAPLPRTSLLKIPRQRRSRDMVHAILDAGVRILQEEGTEGFTTNRVADVAGVSVGSLYQYFANRDMIVAGIVERGVLDAEGQVRLAVATAGDADPLPLFEQLVSALLLSFEPYRDLLAEILSVTPVLSATGISALLETRLSDALRDFLVQHSDRYELRGGAPALYAAVNGTIYVSLKWLSERPPHVSRKELVAAFRGQLEHLIVPRARDLEFPVDTR
jgi:AcrR family transcriptional regulator